MSYLPKEGLNDLISLINGSEMTSTKDLNTLISYLFQESIMLFK